MLFWQQSSFRFWVHAHAHAHICYMFNNEAFESSMLTDHTLTGLLFIISWKSCAEQWMILNCPFEPFSLMYGLCQLQREDYSSGMFIRGLQVNPAALIENSVPGNKGWWWLNGSNHSVLRSLVKLSLSHTPLYYWCASISASISLCLSLTCLRRSCGIINPIFNNIVMQVSPWWTQCEEFKNRK